MIRPLLLASCLAIVHAADDDLSGLAGGSLVVLLSDPAQAQRAHYELWRRADPAKDQGWIAFSRNHYSQRIVVCPQGPGQTPITVVLHGFLPPYLREGDYLIDDPDSLFPAEPGFISTRTDSPAIDAYTADGRRVAPFGGNTVLGGRGALIDLDGDGWIERIDTTRYGSEFAAHVEVLEIERVKEKAEPLFTALINWQADDWSFAVVPPAEGRPGEVRLGPADAAGQVLARAVVRGGPTWQLAGEPEVAHLQLLDPRDIWAGLKRLRETPPAFAPDPPADRRPADGGTILDGPSLSGRVAIPPEPPFTYRTLGVDAPAVAAFMAEGRSIRDLEAEAELRDAIPAEVWTLPPRQAALALAEANRSPAHRQRFRLAIDGRDGRVPPPTLVLDLACDSSRCYHDTRSLWRLHCGPAGATLAMAWVEQGGVAFRDPISVLPRHVLRSLAIDPALARQAAEVVWWLDRIRSLDRVGERGASISGSSTADGRGLLQLADGAGVLQFEFADTLWSEAVPERWRSGYDRETALNLVRLLLLEGLVGRLGAAWPERQTAEDLRATTARLLLRPASAANGIVMRAVEAAGVNAWRELDPELLRLAAGLAPDLPALRTREQVEAEIEALRADRNAGERTSALYQELFSLDQRHAQSEQSLLAAITTARDRLAASDDAAALTAWVREGRTGWQWAASRLHGLDRAAYVAALESRLAASTGYHAQALFAAIAAADPDRATAVASATPTGQGSPLAVEAADVLQRAQAHADIAQRVQALAAVLRDPQQDWEVRGRAIELLVPIDEPLRHAEPAIDAALIAVLDAGSTGSDFTLSRACRALARRGRLDQSGRILDLLETATDAWKRCDILAAAVDLAQQGGGPQRERLARFVASHLETTNLRITEVLWAAWALDLRDLAPLVEGLATASPAGIEGPMASSYGGAPRSVAEHRYHLARQIAQIWRERDGAARALLLLALGHDDPQAWDDPARTRRRLEELAPLRQDAAARRAVEGWCTAWKGSNHFPASTIHIAKATAVFGVDLTETGR